MATPGVLMRLSNNSSSSKLAIPGIEAAYTLKANDGSTPSYNSLYFLNDIAPIVNSRSAYDADIKDSSASEISWVICSFINGRDTAGLSQKPQTKPHVLPNPPALGSILVINGSTPRADKEDDYHAWYDQEHGEKLTRVPGWNAARRYALAAVYGNVEAANFYGFNFYDEENGLGGPEWKAGVTDWTLRIRSNAAKPNIRRVWKVESV